MVHITGASLLNEEFAKRKKMNPSYSVRAFARDLEVGKTTVFEVLNGVRRLSNRNINLIAEKLNLHPEIVEKLKSEKNERGTERYVLQREDLSLLDEWYFLAILSLAKLPQAPFTAEWVAERLNIPLINAQDALETLQEKGYIENLNGHLVRKVRPVTTKSIDEQESVINHHKQSLKLAEAALDEVNAKLRDFTTVTYAFDPEKMEVVKDLILNFHRKLGRLIEANGCTEVYRLNIHFFPLTKIK